MLLAHGESPHQAAATLSCPGTWGNSRVIQHGPQSPQIKDAELAAKIIQTVHIYHPCVIRKALKLHTCTSSTVRTDTNGAKSALTSFPPNLLSSLPTREHHTPHSCTHCKTYKPISGQHPFPIDRTRIHPAPRPPPSLKYLYIRPHPPSASFDMTVVTEICWMLFHII